MGYERDERCAEARLAETHEQRCQRLVDVSHDVAPDLNRAVARLMAWCASQDTGEDPGIYFSDVRAVLHQLPLSAFAASREELTDG